MKDNIVGFFLKIGFDPQLESQDFQDINDEFKPFIWGEKGIDQQLNVLKY